MTWRLTTRDMTEQYRRPTNLPQLPPPEVEAEEVVASIRERVKPIIDEKCELERKHIVS